MSASPTSSTTDTTLDTLPTHAPTTRSRPLLGLLLAHAVSVGGNMLTSVALPWFVLSTTGSAAATGLAAFAGSVPLMIGAFFGGAVLDRLGHRRASILADLASGFTVALIPLLHLTVGLPFWLLLVLVVLGALLDAPGATARQALLPDAASAAGMRPERANAVYESVEAGAMLGGPLLAGLLLALVGPASVLWVNAVTFALSALAIGLLLPPSIQPTLATGESYGASLRAGLQRVLGDRLLRTIVVLFTLMSLVLAPLFGVLMPVYIEEAYGSGLRLGLFVATIGGGGLLGALLYGWRGHLLSQRWLFIGGLTGIGLTLAALAAAPPFPLLLAAALFGGLANGPINPLVNTVLQARTPPELRGRVFGTVFGLSMAAAPVGVLSAGFLVEALGVQPTLMIIAALFISVALLTPFMSALHEMDQGQP